MSFVQKEKEENVKKFESFSGNKKKTYMSNEKENMGFRQPLNERSNNLSFSSLNVSGMIFFIFRISEYQL